MSSRDAAARLFKLAESARDDARVYTMAAKYLALETLAPNRVVKLVYLRLDKDSYAANEVRQICEAVGTIPYAEHRRREQEKADAERRCYQIRRDHYRKLEYVRSMRLQLAYHVKECVRALALIDDGRATPALVEAVNRLNHSPLSTAVSRLGGRRLALPDADDDGEADLHELGGNVIRLNVDPFNDAG